MFIEAPQLAAYPNIRHAFFTRLGGVSQGLYASLNGGLGSSDERERVIENRRRMAAQLAVEPDALISVYQVHSRDAVAIDRPWDGERPKADGMATARPGLAGAPIRGSENLGPGPGGAGRGPRPRNRRGCLGGRAGSLPPFPAGRRG